MGRNDAQIVECSTNIYIAFLSRVFPNFRRARIRAKKS